MDELEDVLGPHEIPQTVRAQVGKGSMQREPVTGEIGGRGRDEDLATVAAGTEASSSDDSRPGIVPPHAVTVRLKPGLTRMNCHPNPKERTQLLQQVSLRVERSCERVGRPCEGGHHGVAVTLLSQPKPTMVTNGFVHHVGIPRPRRRHGGRVGLPGVA
jgi:hypothetical protein